MDRPFFMDLGIAEGGIWGFVPKTRFFFSIPLSNMAKKKSGSKVAPPEDGNTKSSSGGANKRESGKIHWFLTLKWNHGIHYPLFNNMSSWLAIHCTRAIYQLERGDTTGYDHLQLQLSLKKKQRFEWFKHHLSPIVHCEITRNIDAAYDYCSKAETRIWGPRIYPEPLETAMVDEMEGLTFKPWQTFIKTILDHKPHPRFIYWFYDPGFGAGKTTFTKHLYVRYPVAFFQAAKKTDIACAWKKEPICVFNFTMSREDKISYDAMESLKDGAVFSSKYESGAKMHSRPTLIVFANWPPKPDGQIDPERLLVYDISDENTIYDYDTIPGWE